MQWPTNKSFYYEWDIGLVSGSGVPGAQVDDDEEVADEKYDDNETPYDSDWPTQHEKLQCGVLHDVFKLLNLKKN